MDGLAVDCTVVFLTPLTLFLGVALEGLYVERSALPLDSLPVMLEKERNAMGEHLQIIGLVGK